MTVQQRTMFTVLAIALTAASMSSVRVQEPDSDPALTTETYIQPADHIMETIRQAIGDRDIQCEAIADGAFLFLAAAPEKIGLECPRMFASFWAFSQAFSCRSDFRCQGLMNINAQVIRNAVMTASPPPFGVTFS